MASRKKSIKIIREKDELLSTQSLKRATVQPHSVDLNDLLDRVTPENIHAEISFGNAVGRELWEYQPDSRPTDCPRS